MSEYDKLIGSLGSKFKTVFNLRDWAGARIVGFEKGENPEKTIVVSGGGHGYCENAVYSSVEVLLKSEVANRIITIPTRDPTGFFRFSEFTQRIFGERIHVSEMREKAHRHVNEIWESDGLTIFIYGNLAIIIPNSIKDFEFLEDRLKEKTNIQRLEGFYLIVPNITMGEDPRLITYRVINRELYDLDVFIDPPQYLVDLLDLLVNENTMFFVDLDCWRKNKIAFFSSKKYLSDLDFHLDTALRQIDQSLIEKGKIEGTIKVKDGVFSIDSSMLFVEELIRNKIPSVKILAPQYDINNLTLAVVSLINSLAFVGF